MKYLKSNENFRTPELELPSCSNPRRQHPPPDIHRMVSRWIAGFVSCDFGLGFDHDGNSNSDVTSRTYLGRD